MKIFLLILFLGCGAGSFANVKSTPEHKQKFSLTDEKKALSKYSSKDFFATLSPDFSHPKRYKATPHHRTHSFARSLCSDQSLKSSFTQFDDTSFVASYTYCKTIGLFLIFPEHYFW